MNFRKYISFLCLFIILSFDQTHSQSLGMVYEASSFNTSDFVGGYYFSYGMIKNIFISFDTPLYNSFHLSIKVGYGWNSDKSGYYYVGPEASDHEEDTKGFPFELDVKYQHFTGSDSVFEPLIGTGIGFYDYTTKYTNSSNDYSTEGFASYILFGMNIHISNLVTTSIQFKKFMTNSISTKYENTTRDYKQKSGISDLAISLGIFFRLQNPEY